MNARFLIGLATIVLGVLFTGMFCYFEGKKAADVWWKDYCSKVDCGEPSTAARQKLAAHFPSAIQRRAITGFKLEGECLFDGTDYTDNDIQIHHGSCVISPMEIRGFRLKGDCNDGGAGYKVNEGCIIEPTSEPIIGPIQ